MITPGQTLENPVTGERFTFTHTAASTDGELLAFDFALRPGGAVPIPHVHPIQTERFEVVDGRVAFRVGRRKIEAEPGDVVEVEPGVAHSFANAGEGEARMRVEVRPALAMEDMFADVVAMAQAGRMNRRGMPRNLLELATLAREPTWTELKDAYDAALAASDACLTAVWLSQLTVIFTPPAAMAAMRRHFCGPSTG